MTLDEQNEIDLSRMVKKRSTANKLLYEFSKWYNMDNSSQANLLIMMGLRRDVLRGTEDELDRLIDSLEERNNAAFMKKLQSGLN